MYPLAVFVLVVAARTALSVKTCVVYDGNGNAVGSDPCYMGTVSGDSKPGDSLPGELRFQNARPRLQARIPDYVAPDFASGRLRFAAGEMFSTLNNGSATVEYVFDVQVDVDEGCPPDAPAVVSVKYLINDYNLHPPVFDADCYTYWRIFPIPKGRKISDVDIIVMDPDFSTREIRLASDGGVSDVVEIVRVSPATGRAAVFELRATETLFLEEDVNMTLTASFEPGKLTSKIIVELRIGNDSGVPKPEFEKSFYYVNLNTSDLNATGEVFPSGVIKLREDYVRVVVDVRPLNDFDLRFEAIHAGSSRDVDIRLTGVANADLCPRDILLQLTARLTDSSGRESEAVTTLLIRLGGNSCGNLESPAAINPHSEENLTIAVTVLSVVVVILLFIIIFGYFKYVCVRKKEDRPPPPCKKCSAPVVLKTRRPTPRKISDYTYPLEKLPAPLETLEETDVEDEGDEKERDGPKPTKEPSAATVPGRTRKRSMTFRESDQESRQNRETLEGDVVEIKNERKSSVDADGRRRKSSAKMYFSVT